MTEARDVEAALTAAHRAIAERDRLHSQLESATNRLRSAEDELRDKQQVARLEADDVTKLESFSGTRIWAMLKGTRGSDLNREQSEAEAALGKAAEAKARRDSAQSTCDELQRKINLLGDVDADLAKALEAKERFLVAADSAEAARLTELAGERGGLQAQQTELTEAVAAGKQAQAELEELVHELGTASGWSTYDTFFGGGMISDAIKHDHMDAAARISRSADEALAAYRRELGDVDMRGLADSLAVSQGTRFLDMWFDNIFTDLHVRSKIQEAIDQADTASTHVVASVADCMHRLEDVRSRIQQVDEERTALLEQQSEA